MEELVRLVSFYLHRIFTGIFKAHMQRILWASPVFPCEWGNGLLVVGCLWVCVRGGVVQAGRVPFVVHNCCGRTRAPACVACWFTYMLHLWFISEHLSTEIWIPWCWIWGIKKDKLAKLTHSLVCKSLLTYLFVRQKTVVFQMMSLQ